MKKYTFICEYKKKPYVTQYNAKSLVKALEIWSKNLDKKIFTEAKRKRIIEEMKNPLSDPISIKEVENVWCVDFLSGKNYILLNIVLTTFKEVIASKYTFICFYKGGIYISQYNAPNIYIGLSLWKNNYIYPKELTLGQKEELFHKIDNQPFTIFTKDVRNVWQNSFIIGDDVLWLIIIDTIK